LMVGVVFQQPGDIDQPAALGSLGLVQGDLGNLQVTDEFGSLWHRHRHHGGRSGGGRCGGRLGGGTWRRSGSRRRLSCWDWGRGWRSWALAGSRLRRFLPALLKMGAHNNDNRDHHGQVDSPQAHAKPLAFPAGGRPGRRCAEGSRINPLDASRNGLGRSSRHWRWPKSGNRGRCGFRHRLGRNRGRLG